ncbi:MAG: lysophospholipid acyltransferase family protein [Chthoniobacteraceae bacterium]
MGFTYAASYQFSKFVGQALFDLRVYGQENIIENGPALLAMNHQSFLDPPFAGISCQREIHYLARKTLFDIPVIGWILRRINVIGVDREGSDVAALKAVMRVLKAGGCTVVFPEGTRTSDGNLQSAKPGAGFIIAKTLAPVVPMRIFGAYDAYPRGAKFPRMTPVTIVVGQPIHFKKADIAGDPRIVFQRLSEQVMEKIAALKNPRED